MVAWVDGSLDGHDNYVSVAKHSKVGCSPKALRFDDRSQKLSQPWLAPFDRAASGIYDGDPVSLNVNAADIEAAVSQQARNRQADVAQTDNSDSCLPRIDSRSQLFHGKSHFGAARLMLWCVSPDSIRASARRNDARPSSPVAT